MTAASAAASPEVASRGVSLELVGLSRRFGSVVALDGLTFSVPPAEVFGFLGPNGAGKTTAMRAIFGVGARGRPGALAGPAGLKNTAAKPPDLQ